MQSRTVNSSAVNRLNIRLNDFIKSRRLFRHQCARGSLLWQKVKKGLSGGRVQSVALRLICDREEEINAFITEEYWSIEAHLNQEGSKKLLEAKYVGKKDRITKEEDL